jgi:crossover junction endodeoxyribonuclease RuvC
MRVFGIDCGTEFTGFGVVELDPRAAGSQLVHIAAGTIRLNKKQTTPERLAQVFAELTAQIELYDPDAVAIEEVFFSANAKSALKLGQVRGVAMLAAAQCGKPVVEYAPLSIKSAVVGYGLAAKEQVQFMVTRLLRLDKSPDSADAADALAIAICHLHTAQSETQIKIQSRVQTKIQTVLKGRGATPSQSLKA